MIISHGDILLVVHRRLYEADLPRLFIGTVDGVDQQIVKVTGHTWVRDAFRKDLVKKKDQRTKIISLSSSGLIVYQLPGDLKIQNLLFITSEEGNMMLTDCESFHMDLTERPHSHREKT